MKTFVTILLLLPLSVYAQKNLKKAEKELDKLLIEHTGSKGVDWKQIQSYFENYIYLTKIQKDNEPVEQGYISYIKLRLKKVVNPPMAQRNKFKKALYKAGILPQKQVCVGTSLIENLKKINDKYGTKIPKESSLWGVINMYKQIAKAEPDATSELIASGLDAALNKDELKKAVFKKVVILSLFVDAVYLDEMFCNEVSEENPYKDIEEYQNLSNLTVGKPIPENRLIDQEFEPEIIEIVEAAREEMEEEEQVFLIVEKMPQFPGGELGLRKYIATNLQYPKEAREQKIEGKIYIRFCINKDGTVDKVSVARGVHPLLDKEGVRVVKSLPKWTPGEQRGKKVRVWYTVPINFYFD